VNRSDRFPASHGARHGLRIRQALRLLLLEPDRRNTDAECAAWAARSNHADSEVEKTRGGSGDQRGWAPFAKRTFLARPERPAAVTAVRAFFGVVSATPTRRTLHPSRSPGCAPQVRQLRNSST